MKENLKLATICLLFLFFTMLTQALCSEKFKPGVSTGDTFLYTFNVFWNPPDPDQAAPASVAELNNTEWVKIIVHNTAGPIVTMNTTTHFKNRTEINAQIWVNILNGEGNGFGFIIAPNLKPNQLAYHMGDSNHYFLLKEELVKNYTFGERTVLRAVVNNTSSDEYVLISHEMYFDKETGVMLEWRITQIPKNAPDANISLVWKIMEFHVTSEGTSTDQNPSPLLGILTLATVATIALLSIAILAYKRKKRKHRS